MLNVVENPISGTFASEFPARGLGFILLWLAYITPELCEWVEYTDKPILANVLCPWNCGVKPASQEAHGSPNEYLNLGGVCFEIGEGTLEKCMEFVPFTLL